MNQLGNEPMINTNVRMPVEMKEELQRRAEASRRKLSDYIRIVLEDHLKKSEG